MRKLCPNIDREDSLDTVLEVPIPEEMYNGPIPGMRAWLKTQAFDKASETDACAAPPGPGGASRPQPVWNAELQLLLKLGTPLIFIPVPHDHAFSQSIRDCPIQVSSAKYIIHQYIAATGGQRTLQSVDSMYAVGKLRMSASEFHRGSEDKGMKPKGNSEVGAFVLWQKSPELWFFELLMAGCKLTAGCYDQISWRQSTIERSHITKGPPRPLRRSLQGLDPRATANLFSDAVCIGEKIIKGEGCFILKMEANADMLCSRSTPSLDIIRHTIWGYFSQRTGLLMQLEDSHLLSMTVAGRTSRTGNENNVIWEASMESVIDDYRTINGIKIAHAGRTTGTMHRYGEGSVNHNLKMEEVWVIDEADFNLWGLTMDHFLPPSDLKRDEE
ncbi:hypothetical protein LUZ60_001556 [Juncus effusus]|nr:hypothetical protein LUZ60_001556 [Juncus effusus]